MGIHFKFFFTFAVLTIFIASCKQDSPGITSMDTVDQNQMIFDPGKAFQLLSSNCFACHNPNPDLITRVAPTLAEIKIAYKHKYEKQDEFSKAILEYMNDPKKENTLMNDAVEKYGVMPKMNFTQEDLKQIAAYLYSSEIEKEGWYKNVYPEEKQKYAEDDSKLTVKDKGRKLAMSTKAILGKNLLQAIQKEGTSGAITFCNTRAIFLTDSMSNELGARIKRVSDLNRNPQNTANEQELNYIRNAKVQIAAGNEAEALIIESPDYYTGYYPIMTNNMCLQCHGIPDQDVKPEVLNTLKSLYPEDLATGFKEGDLRGIWVIEMDK